MDVGPPDHPANWYKNLKFGPMTRQNQYFYGTLLDKTQKDEPAGRTIRQVLPFSHQFCTHSSMAWHGAPCLHKYHVHA